MYFREDEALIHVSVQDVTLDNAPWTSLEGGAAEAQNVNTRPGGVAPSVDLGGPVTRSDITVTRLYSDKLHKWLVSLENAVGKKTASVSYTPTDGDGAPAGDTITYTGVVKSCTRPTADANASAASFLSLVIGVNEQVTPSSN